MKEGRNHYWEDAAEAKGREWYSVCKFYPIKMSLILTQRSGIGVNTSQIVLLEAILLTLSLQLSTMRGV